MPLSADEHGSPAETSERVASGRAATPASPSRLSLISSAAFLLLSRGTPGILLVGFPGKSPCAMALDIGGDAHNIAAALSLTKAAKPVRRKPWPRVR